MANQQKLYVGAVSVDVLSTRKNSDLTGRAVMGNLSDVQGGTTVCPFTPRTHFVDGDVEDDPENVFRQRGCLPERKPFGVFFVRHRGQLEQPVYC